MTGIKPKILAATVISFTAIQYRSLNSFVTLTVMVILLRAGFIFLSFTTPSSAILPPGQVVMFAAVEDTLHKLFFFFTEAVSSNR